MVIQHRAHVTRARILAGAAVIFDRDGFAAASLGDIAAEAGVTKGALYFHFASKEHLAVAVIDAEHSTTSTAGQAVLAEIGPGLEAIILMTAAFAERLRDEPIVRAGIRLTIEASAFSDGVREPYLDWMRAVEDLAAAAVEQGDILPDVDPATFARFLIPTFTGVQLVSDVFTAREDLMGRVVEMWEFLLRAIVPGERRPRFAAIVADAFPAAEKSAGVIGEGAVQASTP